MRIQNGLLAAALVSVICMSHGAFAKTAKDCTAEWRADKAGMQARGTTEKAYVEQCKGGAEPTAAAPSAKPTESVAPAPRQSTATGAKTARDCTAEWRADKAGMQARGTTEKAYVEQCKGGSAPTAAAPEPKPTAVAPTTAAPTPQTNASPSQKTAKDCIAEWRADKAGMQARGTTEKAYVEQCKTGGTMPSATSAPAPKPTVVAPAPAPSKPAPTATEAAPAPAPRKDPRPRQLQHRSQPPHSNRLHRKAARP